jgi:uncharacterized protein YodC (DUF2158 family)
VTKKKTDRVEAEDCGPDCGEDKTCPQPCPAPCYGVGDCVKLKSGGPAMTVTAVTCCGRVQVEWFGGSCPEPFCAEYAPCCLAYCCGGGDCWA